MRSEIYIKFSQSINGANWGNLEDARFYSRFRKDLFNMCNQLDCKFIEDFFSADQAYLLEHELMEEKDKNDEDNLEEWFQPQDAIELVGELRRRILKKQTKYSTSRLIIFFDSLLQALETAKEADLQFHLSFNDLA